MISKHNFRELKIWKSSMLLAKSIFEFTKTLPEKEKYGLISQMNRCSVSVPSNIAEGSAKTDKDFCRFLSISLGSLYELETQLTLCQMFTYIEDELFNKTQIEIVEIQKSIMAFMKYLDNTTSKQPQQTQQSQ